MSQKKVFAEVNSEKVKTKEVKAKIRLSEFLSK